MKNSDETKEKFFKELIELRKQKHKFKLLEEERNKTIEAIKQSEERFRKLSEASFEGISISEKGVILDINKTFASMFGYEPYEIKGIHVSKLVASEYQNDVIHKMLSGYDKPYESVCVKKDGTIFPVEVCGKSIPHSGRTLRVTAVRDVTVLKQMNDKLQATNDRLQRLLLASPTVIYTCKASGDYGATFVSENITSQLGYEPREFTENSRFWIDNVHQEDVQQVIAGLQNLFDSGFYVHEYRFLHKDGTYRWMHDELKLVNDETGNPLEIIGYWRDVTESKQMEEERDRLIRELQEALNKVKTLSGFLPICNYCKKIRDDNGYWNQVEDYIKKHSDAEFSHGLCPECAKKYHFEVE